MFLSDLKCLRRLERQVKFAKNRCCKIKPVAVSVKSILSLVIVTHIKLLLRHLSLQFESLYLCLRTDIRYCMEEITS